MVKRPATLTSDSDSNSPKKKPKSKQLSQKPLRIESSSSDSSSESSDSSSEEEDHGPSDKENVSKSKKHHRKALKKPQVKHQIILVSCITTTLNWLNLTFMLLANANQTSSRKLVAGFLVQSTFSSTSQPSKLPCWSP